MPLVTIIYILYIYIIKRWTLKVLVTLTMLINIYDYRFLSMWSIWLYIYIYGYDILDYRKLSSMSNVFFSEGYLFPKNGTFIFIAKLSCVRICTCNSTKNWDWVVSVGCLFFDIKLYGRSFIDFSGCFDGLSCNLHFFANPLLKCALSQQIGGGCLWAWVYSHAVFDIHLALVGLPFSWRKTSCT